MRSFVICDRKVVQMKIISICQYSSWRTFSLNITKKRTFFKFTLEYIPKKGAFLFFSTLKNDTFFRQPSIWQYSSWRTFSLNITKNNQIMCPYKMIHAISSEGIGTSYKSSKMSISWRFWVFEKTYTWDLVGGRGEGEQKVLIFWKVFNNQNCSIILLANPTICTVLEST